jgi:hypothetical protein
MRNSPEYQAWVGMKSRCLNPKREDFEHWGGRGVQVHPEWIPDFMAFYEHVGPRPSPKHSLDRIDNAGHYEPGNVRWATVLEQHRNMRNTKLTLSDARFIKHWRRRGHSQSSVAKAFGISRELVSRIDRGLVWKDAH